MLKTNEIAGEGNSYDFGARMQDGRLGRWLSLDPLKALYPTMSPFNFGGNNPIYFVDTDGKKIVPHGEYNRKMMFVAQLQSMTTLKVEYDIMKQIIVITGDPQNDLDRRLLEACQSNNVNNIFLYNTLFFKPSTGNMNANIWGGSWIRSSSNGGGPSTTEQWVNPETLEFLSRIGVSNSSTGAAHELIECYVSGVNFDSKNHVNIPTVDERGNRIPDPIYSEIHGYVNRLDGGKANGEALNSNLDLRYDEKKGIFEYDINTINEYGQNGIKRITYQIPNNKITTYDDLINDTKELRSNIIRIFRNDMEPSDLTEQEQMELENEYESLPPILGSEGK